MCVRVCLCNVSSKIWALDCHDATNMDYRQWKNTVNDNSFLCLFSQALVWLYFKTVTSYDNVFLFCCICSSVFANQLAWQNGAVLHKYKWRTTILSLQLFYSESSDLFSFSLGLQHCSSFPLCLHFVTLQSTTCLRFHSRENNKSPCVKNALPEVTGTLHFTGLGIQNQIFVLEGQG